MNTLPTSIEVSLEDAGFTPTEILILKKLFVENGLTERQLAAKTGKSTGLIDHAMKKLLKKDIVTREMVNEVPKYFLHSLDSVKKWMESDVHTKREMLLRRYQNFESFLSTLDINQSRPDIVHFEGEEGMKKAYTKLLDQGEKEMLQYLPVMYKEEEDPLRSFRVQYFRERHRRGIFSKILAHDTPLGRRFKSRDIFEYRETKLLLQQRYPFTSERVIVGDYLACFDHKANKACIIKYPQLVQSERELFLSLWNMRDESPTQRAGNSVTENDEASYTVSRTDAKVNIESASPYVTLISGKTRAFSQLRDFFLSKTSLTLFFIFAIVAAGMTYGMYRYTSELNLERMKERVKAIASTGAYQFDPKDLEELQVESDWKKPQWAKVVHQLEKIRLNNEDAYFVYIFRKSKADPSKIEFVSDSHSIDPYAKIDINKDGVIDEADLLCWPSQAYPDAPQEAFQAFYGPTTNDDFYKDSWGNFLSGYAPIRNANGDTAAILAVDIQANQLDKLNARAFTPLLGFFVLFFTFAVIRLAAFNRFLFKEIWHIFRRFLFMRR